MASLDLLQLSSTVLLDLRTEVLSFLLPFEIFLKDAVRTGFLLGLEDNWGLVQSVEHL